MAELEDEVIDTEDVEITQDDLTELTVEDYQKEKTRREKAEKAIVEMKKQLKEKETTPSNILTEEQLELRDEITDFVKTNPDFKEYKADLMKYAKTFVSEWNKIETAIRKAKALIENDDKTIENRKKTNSMHLTDSELSSNTTYTKKELEWMSQFEYNKAKDKIESWKARII